MDPPLWELRPSTSVCSGQTTSPITCLIGFHPPVLPFIPRHSGLLTPAFDVVQTAGILEGTLLGPGRLMGDGCDSDWLRRYSATDVARAAIWSTDKLIGPVVSPNGVLSVLSSASCCPSFDFCAISLSTAAIYADI